MVTYGGVSEWSPWFDSEDDAKLELRCLEKRHSFEVIETMEDEGFYPERAIIMEEKYQQSGRTNGLFTGLMSEDGQISNDNT